MGKLNKNGLYLGKFVELKTMKKQRASRRLK